MSISANSDKIDYSGFHAAIEFYPVNSFEEMERREMTFKHDRYTAIMQHEDGWISMYIVWSYRIALYTKPMLDITSEYMIPTIPDYSVGECWSFCEQNYNDGMYSTHRCSKYIYRCYGRDFSHHKLGLFHPRYFYWVGHKPSGAWSSRWDKSISSQIAYTWLYQQESLKLDTEYLV